MSNAMFSDLISRWNKFYSRVKLLLHLDVDRIFRVNSQHLDAIYPPLLVSLKQ